MIERLEITGVHFKPDEKLNKYVTKKIGKLDKYMNKKVAESARIEVKLKEIRAKEQKKSNCEVIISMPKERITASETTMNMYAAVDIVEAKLKTQLKKYKEKRHEHHVAHKEKKIRTFLGKVLPKRR